MDIHEPLHDNGVDKPKHVKHAHRFMVVYLLIILLVLVAGGMYRWQNQKVKTLNAQITSQNTQISKINKQLAEANIRADKASLANSQAQVNSDNTSRTNDANSILAGYNDYADSNQSLEPNTASTASSSSVYFCTTSCKSTNSSLVNLVFYKPSNVSIQTDPTGHLSVPNDNTIYVTWHANCTNKNTAVDAEDGAAFAVIYALQNGNSITQQCLSD